MSLPSGPARASLVLLFPEPTLVDAERVRELVASFDPELASATVDAAGEGDDGPVGLMVRIGEHAVLLRGGDGPLPEVLVEPCIQLAHYDEADKDRARAHRAVLLVEYVGDEASPLLAHVAAAAVAGALSELGAIAVVNLRARTSVPAGLLAKERPDMIAWLGALPPLLVYAGFAKYVVEGVDGVWMRTHGASALGLPNFARLAPSHAAGEETFTIFSDMMRYLIDSGAPMSPGDVAQVGEDRFTRLRAPNESEEFLLDEGPALVVEVLDLEGIERLRNIDGSA